MTGRRPNGPSGPGPSATGPCSLLVLALSLGALVGASPSALAEGGGGEARPEAPALDVDAYAQVPVGSIPGDLAAADGLEVRRFMGMTRRQIDDLVRRRVLDEQGIRRFSPRGKVVVANSMADGEVEAVLRALEAAPAFRAGSPRPELRTVIPAGDGDGDAVVSSRQAASSRELRALRAKIRQEVYDHMEINRFTPRDVRVQADALVEGKVKAYLEGQR